MNCQTKNFRTSQRSPSKWWEKHQLIEVVFMLHSLKFFSLNKPLNSFLLMYLGGDVDGEFELIFVNVLNE
jgi:hypothetical protein